MRYVYNEERNRIACGVNSPHFIKASYENKETHEIRALFLYAVTNNPKQLNTVAERYMEDIEQISEITEIPRRLYEKWLGNGEDTILIKNEEIPISFITDFFIAGDSVKSGYLSKKQELLTNRDAMLLDDIYISYQLTKEDKDVVRELPDIEM